MVNKYLKSGVCVPSFSHMTICTESLGSLTVRSHGSSVVSPASVHTSLAGTVGGEHVQSGGGEILMTIEMFLLVIWS